MRIWHNTQRNKYEKDMKIKLFAAEDRHPRKYIADGVAIYIIMINVLRRKLGALAGKHNGTTAFHVAGLYFITESI